MYKCKYNIVDFALVLMVIPDLLIVSMTIIFTSIAYISNSIDLSIVPWSVYVIIGGFVFLTHIIYLIIYLCSKNVCQYDNDKICLKNAKEIDTIFKKQINRINYRNCSFLICWMMYEVYGEATFYCNEDLNHKVIRVKIFPHVIRRLRKMGYPIRYSN